jgi:putative hydrolase of the HAD superfamily
VTRPAACLIDVYETILSCDFSRHNQEMPALAGVGPDAWRAGIWRVGPLFNLGRLTKAEGFAQILQECDVEPRADLVSALVATDRELLLASAYLYDDSISFLENLRSHGVRAAIVSNCSEHTRALLVKLGVPELVDVVVLSCEVGAVKPSAQIFRHALEQLRVPAGAALFVDDQAAFCAGAVALGISAAQIVRGELDGVRGVDGKLPAAGTTVVGSLAEVAEQADHVQQSQHGSRGRLDPLRLGSATGRASLDRRTSEQPWPTRSWLRGRRVGTRSPGRCGGAC